MAERVIRDWRENLLDAPGGWAYMALYWDGRFLLPWFVS
jgi:hypothetical protein